MTKRKKRLKEIFASLRPEPHKEAQKKRGRGKRYSSRRRN